MHYPLIPADVNATISMFASLTTRQNVQKLMMRTSEERRSEPLTKLEKQKLFAPATTQKTSKLSAGN